MYGFWGCNFDLHLLPISLKEAAALCSVFIKVNKYPLLLFPFITKSSNKYQHICLNDVKNAAFAYYTQMKTAARLRFTCMYNLAALRFKWQLMPLPQQHLPEPTLSTKAAESVVKEIEKDINSVTAYEKYDNYSIKHMMKEYVLLTSKRINIDSKVTEFIVRLPNSQVSTFDALEMKMFCEYRELLFSNVHDIEFLPVPRAIPHWILSMYQNKEAFDCSYFLEMSYKVRKYLLTEKKPCKKLTLFKMMEYIFNRYEAAYDNTLDFTEFYIDVIETEHVDLDTFQAILQFLGYTVKEGKVMHLQKRKTPKTIDITSHMARKRDMQQFNHKMLNIGGSDLRGAPKTDFEHVSPFNIASI